MAATRVRSASLLLALVAGLLMIGVSACSYPAPLSAQLQTQVNTRVVTPARKSYVFEFDAVVGHGDSSAHPTHFRIMNIEGQIEVTEFPGGDTGQAHTYMGPRLSTAEQNLAPTAAVRDVNGDGKPDLVITVGQQRVIFINTGSSFRLAQPRDQVTVPLYI